jgi:hypothetical protein
MAMMLLSTRKKEARSTVHLLSYTDSHNEADVESEDKSCNDEVTVELPSIEDESNGKHTED